MRSIPIRWFDWTALHGERVNAIQLELGAYAENAMVRFVTGDIPLTDESWNDYTAQLDNLGLQEMLENLAKCFEIIRRTLHAISALPYP